jgi:hypothetical protein
MRSLVGNVRRTPPSGAQPKASVLWRGGCDESEAAGEVASCRVNQHGQLCFGHLALVAALRRVGRTDADVSCAGAGRSRGRFR